MAAKKKTATKTRLPKMPDPYEVGSKGLFRLVDETGKEVAQVPQLPEGLGVKLLEAMLFQRALDQRMLNLQRQGRIGFYGTAKGQEGAVLGSGSAFEEQDWLFPALREGAAALWRGMPLEQYIAQCFGNAADATLGRQMPCHYSYADSRYVSLSSPIGTQITHAAGAARAIQIKGRTDQIVGGYLGDAADLVLFDDGRLEAELAGADRRDVAAGAGADHHEIELVVLVRHRRFLLLKKRGVGGQTSSSPR